MLTRNDMLFINAVALLCAGTFKEGSGGILIAGGVICYVIAFYCAKPVA